MSSLNQGLFLHCAEIRFAGLFGAFQARAELPGELTEVLNSLASSKWPLRSAGTVPQHPLVEEHSLDPVQTHRDLLLTHGLFGLLGKPRLSHLGSAKRPVCPQTNTKSKDIKGCNACCLSGVNDLPLLEGIQ